MYLVFTEYLDEYSGGGRNIIHCYINFTVSSVAELAMPVAQHFFWRSATTCIC